MRFSSFTPHQSKYKMRENIYCLEKFSTKKVCLFSLGVKLVVSITSSNLIYWLFLTSLYFPAGRPRLSIMSTF